MKRTIILSIALLVIFFSGISSCSMKSQESDDYQSYKLLIDLQLCMTDLWSDMFRGDKDSYDAYNAFLDASEYCFPVLPEEVMDKLVKYKLAYRCGEGSESFIDPEKLELWSKQGSLGDGMKPIVKGLR